MVLLLRVSGWVVFLAGALLYFMAGGRDDLKSAAGITSVILLPLGIAMTLSSMGLQFVQMRSRRGDPSAGLGEAQPDELKTRPTDETLGGRGDDPAPKP
jgi:hypothetical protein